MDCKRRRAPFFGRWTEANQLCTGFWQVKQPRAIPVSYTHLEVVFSDSVAGAMLVAIGHQHSVGGATAVIFANEDGEQNATIPVSYTHLRKAGEENRTGKVS